MTLPNGNPPPHERPSPGHHGNGALWTVLWPEGIVRAGPSYVRPDGSVGMKFAWWRGARGKLAVEGRRLDAPAPRLRPELGDGYGQTGLQPTGLIFPTEGCWEVTGRVGGASLTFVTLVVKVGQDA